MHPVREYTILKSTAILRKRILKFELARCSNDVCGSIEHVTCMRALFKAWFHPNLVTPYSFSDFRFLFPQ